MLLGVAARSAGFMPDVRPISSAKKLDFAKSVC